MVSEAGSVVAEEIGELDHDGILEHRVPNRALVKVPGVQEQHVLEIGTLADLVDLCENAAHASDALIVICLKKSKSDLEH